MEKRLFIMLFASFPLILTTEIAPLPGGVEQATIA
jgi:hypothetical protein